MSAKMLTRLLKKILRSVNAPMLFSRPPIWLELCQLRLPLRFKKKLNQLRKKLLLKPSQRLLKRRLRLKKSIM